jgi:hypothetical protein
MHHLLSRDLSKFRPWAAQQDFLDDAALVNQKLLSLTPPLAWLREVLESINNRPASQSTTGHWDKGLPIGADWPSPFPRAVALQRFRDWAAIAKPHGANTYTGSEQRFWKEIAQVIPQHLTKVKDSAGNRSVIISHAKLCAGFQAYMRGGVG